MYLDSAGMFKEASICILAAVSRQERVRLREHPISESHRNPWLSHPPCLLYLFTLRKSQKQKRILQGLPE